MHAANESGNGEVPSRVEVFMVFENELRWVEVQKECNCMQLLTLKKLCDLTAVN